MDAATAALLVQHVQHFLIFRATLTTSNVMHNITTLASTGCSERAEPQSQWRRVASRGDMWLTSSLALSREP